MSLDRGFRLAPVRLTWRRPNHRRRRAVPMRRIVATLDRWTRERAVRLNESKPGGDE